tara:strand:- start:1175 stop:1405 length:231 start_codon:yes stop_codon:yes gene_type:complete
MKKPKLLDNTKPIDRIVQLLNIGLTTADVYRDIIKNYNHFITTRDKQELIDFIEQTDQCNVFAVGVIPDNDKKKIA